MGLKSSGKDEIKVTAKDLASAPGRLKKLGGSQSDDWNNRVANDTLQALWLKNSNEAEREKQIHAALAALMGIAPRDELEGMMAAQLLAAHSASMECYRRAMIGDQSFEGRRENLAQANKLSRTFTTLLEALNHHRGKGQQKVTVEHVHVHSGGQAIVGAVQTGMSGANQPKAEDHQFAKQIEHAPEPPMWSSNTQEDAVPVACDDERPLPDARRHGDRSTKGK